MKNKIKLFSESLKLVWKSAPGWAAANIAISVLRSFLPLALIWMIKGLIDGITQAASATPDTPIVHIVWLIIAVVVIWFLDEACSDIGNFVRKKQSMKLEAYMYGLLHAKAVKLDLINFERPEYYDGQTAF
jgi:ABC-type multidrug transport system fused ATPase/permease subunit